MIAERTGCSGKGCRKRRIIEGKPRILNFSLSVIGISDRLVSVPLRPADSRPGGDQRHRDMGAEGVEAGVLRGKAGVDDRLHRVVDLRLQRLHRARPRPDPTAAAT